MAISKHIPPLAHINDAGERYMVGRHRVAMAEMFGITRSQMRGEYKGKRVQDQLMKALRMDDPQKYEKWYDIIVRGIEPEPEVVKKEIQLTDDVVEKIQKVIDSYEGSAIENVRDQLSGQFERLTESFAQMVEEKINEESKKFNQIEYVVKANNETRKLKGPLPEEFQKILDLASQRINIMLVGPSGCGKTHISSQVAKALGLPFAAQSCSAGMSESVFSGWLLPIEKAGQFVYVPSEFVKIYENGGVFLFDEIDGADSNTLLFLNQALANSEFYLPQRFENPRIKRHKDFVAIAAANTFGNGATAMYSGRNLLDGATMDRFRMGIVPMDYSAEVEEKLVDAEVLAWGRKVRELIRSRNIRKIMSTRLLLDATKMKKAGWSLDQIASSYFADWSKDDRRMVLMSFPELTLEVA